MYSEKTIIFKIKKCYNVFTIHDLRRIYFSESIFIKFLYKFFFGFFLRSADNIIVVSHSIKKEILSYFNKLKVSVCFLYTIIHNFHTFSINNQRLSEKFQEDSGSLHNIIQEIELIALQINLFEYEVI